MAPKRTTDTNIHEFASLEAVRGILSPAKPAGPQTHERTNDLEIIRGYRGAGA